MRFGEVGWAMLLLGLPGSYFLMRLITPFSQLDIWHTNTLWAQGWSLALIGWSLTHRQGWVWLPRAAVCLLGWVTGLMLWLFAAQSLPNQPYPLALLTGVGHLWLLALLVAATLSFWTDPIAQRLVHGLWWVTMALSLYGLCQLLTMDQFFHNIDPTVRHDLMVGVIGNPTHFGCLLALLLPFTLMASGWQRWSGVLVAGLILASGSSAALLAMSGIVLWWVWARSWRWGATLLGAYVVLAWGLNEWNPQLSDAHGRWEAWSAWWDYFKRQKAIFGFGLGFVKNATHSLPLDHPLLHWKHLHNEYLQWFIELGVMGLGLLGWVIVDLIRRCRRTPWTPLRVACGQSLLAMGLISLLNFPWHLWQLGIVGVFSYIHLVSGTEGIA